MSTPAATQTKGLVLVTGANGYVASASVLALLQAGYSVRGTVRSLRSAEPLISALPPSLAANFTAVQVPNITTPGAFDEAVKGVDAVAHIAAPVSATFTDPAPVMHDAVESVLRALESATLEPKVKSFVFMSSLAAIKEAGRDGGFHYTEEDWNDKSLEMVEELGTKTPGFIIYGASKTASEKALWKFRDEKRPGFAVTALNPCFIAGPPAVPPTTPADINMTTLPIFSVLSGEPLPKVFPGVFPGFVDIRDVARLVVFSIDNADETNGERVLLASAYSPPQAIADIIREKYPEYREKVQEGTPGEGYKKGDYGFVEGMVYDGSKAVRLTGQEYIPWEKTVVDAVEAFKGLL